MGAVDDYLTGLPAGADRAELERMHDQILALVPDCGQGVSYNMACYLYRGQPVAALVANKKFLSWYPYSGQVITQIAALSEWPQTKGSLHFSPSQPLSEQLVAELISTKMHEIDVKLDQ